MIKYNEQVAVKVKEVALSHPNMYVCMYDENGSDSRRSPSLPQMYVQYDEKIEVNDRQYIYNMQYVYNTIRRSRSTIALMLSTPGALSALGALGLSCVVFLVPRVVRIQPPLVPPSPVTVSSYPIARLVQMPFGVPRRLISYICIIRIIYIY